MRHASLSLRGEHEYINQSDLEFIVVDLAADVFTMPVIMAVGTTLMAGPLLKRLWSATGPVIPVGLEA